LSKNNEKTGLTYDEYKRCIKVKPLRVSLLFVGIFCILAIFLYWFHSSMRENSNLKVNEAVVLLAGADELPAEIGPRTVELEEMVVQTEDDVSWLVNELTADSFSVRHENKLKEFYRREKHFLPGQLLSEDWKTNLSPSLAEWYRRGLEARKKEVQSLESEFNAFVERNRRRKKRAEEIRLQLEMDKHEDIPWYYYKENSEQLEKLLDNIDSAVKTANFNSPTIPPAVYGAAAEIITPLSRFTLQYRRLSALTSAPTAYLYAESHLQDALRLDPKNPEAYYHLGRVYEKMELDVISSEYYIRALKVDPSFSRATEIVKMFKNKLEAEPDSPRSHYDLGWVYYELGREKEAKEELLAVLRMEESKNTMARVLAKKRLGYLIHGEPPYHKMAYH
jgi:tetratricopeptide (TPR) repeat protein